MEIKIERQEEITIQFDDIDEAAKNIFHEVGYDPDSIRNEMYIIDEILMVASPDLRYEDENELEVWREQIDKRVWDDLIRQFWDAYKGYANCTFGIKVEHAKESLKRSN